MPLLLEITTGRSNVDRVADRPRREHGDEREQPDAGELPSTRPDRVQGDEERHTEDDDQPEPVAARSAARPQSAPNPATVTKVGLRLTT